MNRENFGEGLRHQNEKRVAHLTPLPLHSDGACWVRRGGIGRLKSDRLFWMAVLTVGLALAGMSVLVLPSSAQSPAPVPVAGATTSQGAGTLASTPGTAYDDGDGGDELLEHWGDPKYSLEARRQLAGLSVLFVAFGAASFGKRAALRRVRAHD